MDRNGKLYIVKGVRDRKTYSIPADFYRAEGIALYLSSVTDKQFRIVEVTPETLTPQQEALVKECLAQIQ